MPICLCGFNFARAIIKGRRIESYAAIRNRDYMKVMRKERAILSERNAAKRIDLGADASQWVGNLMRCPECGDWTFLKPGPRDSPIVRLKPAPLTQRARSTGRRVRQTQRSIETR